MDAKKWAKNFFLASAIYDFVLGLLFLFFYVQIFSYFGIEIPKFPEYLQVSAAFVATLGIGYFMIYRNIERNRDLWKLGIMYKFVYIFLVSYYYFITQTANDIFFWFALIDALFLIPFIGLYKKVYAR
ncbi:hypothetical protein J4463_00615 [Candidatus Pacearchaeota archaeon]|nr:hypothetical protein [Candidatus Pacearchaeota archaeon]